MNDIGIPERLAFYACRVELWWHKTRWMQLLCKGLLCLALFVMFMFIAVMIGILTPDTNY